MLPYFILGIALLAGLLLAGRWFATADPKTLLKVLKWLLIGVIGTVALFFILTGRLAWALFALPALLPWFMRARSAHRMYRNFSRMAAAAGGGGSSGQTSDVETRFLRMALDHDSGAMTGEIRTPIGPAARQPDPEQAVGLAQARSFGVSLVDSQLLAKREILKDEASAAGESQVE